MSMHFFAFLNLGLQLMTRITFLHERCHFLSLGLPIPSGRHKKITMKNKMMFPSSMFSGKVKERLKELNEYSFLEYSPFSSFFSSSFSALMVRRLLFTSMSKSFLSNPGAANSSWNSFGVSVMLAEGKFIPKREGKKSGSMSKKSRPSTVAGLKKSDKSAGRLPFLFVMVFMIPPFFNFYSKVFLKRSFNNDLDHLDSRLLM